MPDEDYRMGRMAVLRLFLGRPRIFYHTIMFEEEEGRARSNLKAELKELGE